SVAVSASEIKYRDRIQVEVRSGVLIIRYDNNGKWNTGNKKLKAYISFKEINRLKVSGACDVYIIDDWKADNLKIDLSGASNLTGKIDGQKLMVDLSGASDMTLSGSMGQLDIEASGASGFRGYDMVVDYCDARASGASDIKITVNKELSAEASGASDVNYKGNGLIRDVKTSGSSSISRRS
ncbi:MAG TPA: head GIN domain-containing protein, partial [Chitinophagaceae bacterium]|nr:head GIN domain-containing protein [Chitinophagaceae bacterium]